MIPTLGQSHLQLAVKDLEQSANFYKSLFGMTELRRSQWSVMMQTPGSHEVFTLNTNPEHNAKAGQSGGMQHFGFRLKEPLEMQAVAEVVQRAGGKVLEHGGSVDSGRLFCFSEDPDGYEVEVFWDA